MTEHAPWNGTYDDLQTHYGTDLHSLGRTPEYIEEEAARDWAQNGSPHNGDRFGDYFVRDGQLWNQGRWGAADGSAEPYVVQAQIDAAWAEHEAAQQDDNGAGRAR